MLFRIAIELVYSYLYSLTKRTFMSAFLKAFIAYKLSWYLSCLNTKNPKKFILLLFIYFKH